MIQENENFQSSLVPTLLRISKDIMKTKCADVSSLSTEKNFVTLWRHTIAQGLKMSAFAIFYIVTSYVQITS